MSDSTTQEEPPVRSDQLPEEGPPEQVPDDLRERRHRAPPEQDRPERRFGDSRRG